MGKISKSKYVIYILPISILILCILAIIFQIIFNNYNYYSVNVESENRVEYIIGVSQSKLSDPWQLRIYEEILQESNNYDNIKVIFTDADGNDEKQCEDINKLMGFEIDLLIVSPTNSEAITSKISQVYNELPVIVLDRGVTGYDYNLYIGSDNSMIGKQVGEYIIQELGSEGGKVVEIIGSPESNATKERSLGFRNEVNVFEDIEIIEEINCEWNRDKAEDKMYDIFKTYNNIDIIFAHNDAMALGAYKAYKNLGYSYPVKFISVEGLNGNMGGIELIEKGILNCTFTVATGGKEAIQYAIDILNKESGIPKKVILRSTKINKGNIEEYKSKQAEKAIINESNKGIKLGFCNVGKEGGWRDANKDSIVNAAINAGIELVYLEADLSQEKQIEILRGFINMDVDIISFSPVIEEGWDEVLAEIKAANIPVIIADRMIKTEDKTLYTAFIGSDFREEGRRAARWIVNNMELEKELNIVEIQGIKSSTPTVERKLGFEEIIKEYNNINLIKSSNANFTFDEGKNVMKTYLIEASEENKQIDVVFSHNDDMALGAIKAIEEFGLFPGEDIKIVSIDAIKQAILAIKNGKLNCSVECNPLIGPQIIKLATDIVHGKDSPMTIITEEGIFESENFDYNWLNRKY